MRADTASVEILLAVETSVHDRLIAELYLLGFEAFLEDEDALHAYAPAAEWSSDLDLGIRAILSDLGLTVEPRVRFIEPKNWNQAWEGSIHPLVVDRFFVAPSWRRKEDTPDGLIRVEIDPKMSFGTGYHATTRLMLRMAPSFVQEDSRVLDVGTGTGILAIAAARLGAAYVLGIDVEAWAERNARENCERNRVSDVVEIRLVDIRDLADGPFDVVFANIQLDVIVSALPSLVSKLLPGGSLLVSGILASQADDLISAAGRLGLSMVATNSEAEWWAAALRSD